MSLFDATGVESCKRCGEVARAERDRLQAENAKLREENQSIGMAAYELGRKSMADENAKLRELVRDMWSAYHDGATNKEFRALPDRLRELGVEL